MQQRLDRDACGTGLWNLTPCCLLAGGVVKIFVPSDDDETACHDNGNDSSIQGTRPQHGAYARGVDGTAPMSARQRQPYDNDILSKTSRKILDWGLTLDRDRSNCVTGQRSSVKISVKSGQRFNHNFTACDPIWCELTANSFAIRHRGGNYPIRTCPPFGGPENFLFE
ncbi:hypothetical protein BDZ89DRAFT_1052581 [Hymenopellis radicata]|nr:hypothetical protein BDZ89DRAFT_1052581 [Hymenopellis radicata]